MKWLIRALTQLPFPQPFRIPWQGDGTDFLVGMALPGIREATRPPEASYDLPAHLDVGLIKAIGNQRYRIESGLANLVKTLGETRELRSIRRASDKLTSAFGVKVEVIDLTGQTYDERRTDFVPLGEPEPSAEVTRKTIWACEQPAIYICGKLVQQAKGIVAIPLMTAVPDPSKN